MKKTHWFPMEAKPVRGGWYEVSFSKRRAYWTLKRWWFYPGFILLQAPTGGQWRGLAKKP